MERWCWALFYKGTIHRVLRSVFLTWRGEAIVKKQTIDVFRFWLSIWRRNRYETLGVRWMISMPEEWDGRQLSCFNHSRLSSSQEWQKKQLELLEKSSADWCHPWRAETAHRFWNLGWDMMQFQKTKRYGDDLQCPQYLERVSRSEDAYKKRKETL